MKTIILLSSLLVGVLGFHKGLRIQEIPLINRVVGGETAQENQIPHQVSLQHLRGSGYQHWCGGSIISREWILTAGHCIDNVSMRVIAGFTRLSGSSIGQTISVDKAIVHPKYIGGVNPNDIALVKLVLPLEYNEAVQPIALADRDYLGDSVISGWGSVSTSNIPSYPDHLQMAKLNIISHEECANAWKKILGSSEPLDEISNVCTLDSNKGACSGDSGGPLTVGSGDELRLVGVVSWGLIPCGYPGAPSVFTRVSSFHDFVSENTNL